MRCEKCGYENQDGFEFCGNCGKPLGRMASPGPDGPGPVSDAPILNIPLSVWTLILKIGAFLLPIVALIVGISDWYSIYYWSLSGFLSMLYLFFEAFAISTIMMVLAIITPKIGRKS